MIELILGGARSGKSGYAERCAAVFSGQVLYIATAEGRDGEMVERIQQHQSRRPDHWQTIEEPVALAALLEKHDGEGRLFLVDCLTLWLSNILFSASEQENEQRFRQQRQALLAILPTLKADILLVSNEVGQGVVPMNAMSRRFVDEAGWLHQAVAELSERVTFVTAGLPQRLKG
jgi:adenosylcobinamide kinase/adenosylcobinamide-phosphate guanylyltransferase